MKRVIILLAGISMTLTSLAQIDSTKQESDTIRVGNMIIIKKPGNDSDHDKDRDHEVKVYSRKSHRHSIVSTNWGIVDIGFTNYNDQTNYGSGEAAAFAPGLGKEDFKLRTGKSSNINIWFFMQRLNVAKGVLNLKYGLGLETNNYRYQKPIKFNTEPTTVVVKDLTTEYKKNKLAADYITVPMMLNFNFTPSREHGFGISVGASAGYLYNSRQKTITAADGKNKKHDDFDLRPWKISYIAELSIGPVRLYGSYATQSMFEKGLNQQPYSIGLRFDNDDW